MKKVGFVYDDIFLKHEMPPGHPESHQRLIQILGNLGASECWNHLIHIKRRRAGDKEILAVHTREYFEKIKTFAGFYDGDTYVSEHSFETALFASGAIITTETAFRTKMDGLYMRMKGCQAQVSDSIGRCLESNSVPENFIVPLNKWCHWIQDSL